ncbi:3-isopropylmalate dehydratase small subunit [Desulfohalotomaculum tongense]|uniref:3-isopropylmalate dehydratase small subunit n=1 Tax=Desulforadius tongensis TaxID=1216062 RepID=UPI00195A68A0|nr:3-isopropylmalate dehydratase small subunit [Desulforadius tongensis]
MKLKGTAWKFGSDIDTDVIIPARHLNTSDPAELAKHCMEDADPEFAAKISAGDVIVAGKNFGCGSSREHAPIAIKAAGISCVIAKSFARIFYRNAFNIGLPIFECAEAAEKVQPGDRLEIDADSGLIKNITRDETYRATPVPEFMQQIIAAGGLINYVSKRVKNNG